MRNKIGGRSVASEVQHRMNAKVVALLHTLKDIDTTKRRNLHLYVIASRFDLQGRSRGGRQKV